MKKSKKENKREKSDSPSRNRYLKLRREMRRRQQMNFRSIFIVSSQLNHALFILRPLFLFPFLSSLA